MLLTACSKENDTINTLNEGIASEGKTEILSKKAIENAEINEKLAYKDFHLATLVEAVITSDTDLTDLEAAASAKEGEPAMYIERVLRRRSSAKGNSTSMDDLTLNSLDAFKDLDGETWYPILTLKRREADGLKNALYLFDSYDEPTEQEIVHAYRMGQSGALELVNANFTETMFNNLGKASKDDPQVFAVTLSNIPPGASDYVMYTEPIFGGGGSGGGTSSSYYQLYKMKIKEKKESWLEKADIKRIMQLWPYINSGAHYEATTSVDGYAIRKVKGSEI